jgi:hypothetical protein
MIAVPSQAPPPGRERAAPALPSPCSPPAPAQSPGADDLCHRAGPFPVRVGQRDEPADRLRVRSRMPEESRARRVRDEVVDQGPPRPLPDNTAGIAIWHDARKPRRRTDLIRKSPWVRDPTRNLSQLSHGPTGQYWTMASMPDTGQGVEGLASSPSDRRCARLTYLHLMSDASAPPALRHQGAAVSRIELTLAAPFPCPAAVSWPVPGQYLRYFPDRLHDRGTFGARACR